MPPELAVLIAFALTALEFETELEWHLSGDRPLIIGRMSLIGELLQQAAFFIVLAGGISVLVWSFLNFTWYKPFLLLVAAIVAVRIVSRPVALRKWLTSALVPPICAVGLVVLQWSTWFA